MNDAITGPEQDIFRQHQHRRMQKDSRDIIAMNEERKRKKKQLGKYLNACVEPQFQA